MQSPQISIQKTQSFHKVDKQYALNSIEKALNGNIVTERDVALIREFINEKRSCSNISTGRANKIAYTLVGWRKIIGPFESNTVSDIYEGKEALNSFTNSRGVLFKQNTIHDWVRILKQFYLWMIENEYSQVPEKKVLKMKTPPKDTMTKVASDLLTPEEITALMKACKQNLDRAIIMMLYEGGFRIGEIGVMKWGDLTFDKYGVVVNVNFKTGKPRYIRLIMATEYIAAWRAEYPFKPEEDALVFVNTKLQPLTHATISKRLRR
ncbi:MAG TPA: tyrosine-type recombinase/integrase, partial [Methanoregulaceae archaeon]|nr:tyrosine-type recombinase/integrase [Methanoregulaceae archaeon]